MKSKPPNSGLSLSEAGCKQLATGIANGRTAHVMHGSPWSSNAFARSLTDESRVYSYNGRSPNGFDYAAVCRPGTDYSDSFLDVCPVSIDEITFAMGDSDYSGDHHVSLVSCLRKHLRTSLSHGTGNRVSIAREMNKVVYECGEKDFFVSCFFATYRTTTRMLRYVNAGHVSPLLVRGNLKAVLHLDTGGPVFGLQHSPMYVEGSVELAPGDRVLALSTGVIDSFCGSRRGTVETVLLALIEQYKQASAEDLADAIVSAAENAAPQVLSDRSIVVASVDGAVELARGAVAGLEALPLSD